jgi:hypothetical protein
MLLAGLCSQCAAVGRFRHDSSGGARSGHAYEQSRIAYADYPTGTVYQPNEHVLELTRAHVLELNQAFLNQQGKPAVVSLPDFTLMARPQRTPRPTN